MSLRPFRDIERRKTKEIKVGKVKVGGNNPISVQSMTNTLTTDIKATIKQINEIHSEGADLVRVSCPDEASSKALKALVDCFSKNKLPLELAKKYLMPEMRVHLANENISIRQEHLEVIRKVALSLSDSFPELSAVSHDDEEVDFWMNVAHMQLHRRSRCEPEFSVFSIQKFVLKRCLLSK